MKQHAKGLRNQKLILSERFPVRINNTLNIVISEKLKIEWR